MKTYVKVIILTLMLVPLFLNAILCYLAEAAAYIYPQPMIYTLHSTLSDSQILCTCLILFLFLLMKKCVGHGKQNYQPCFYFYSRQHRRMYFNEYTFNIKLLTYKQLDRTKNVLVAFHVRF